MTDAGDKVASTVQPSMTCPMSTTAEPSLWTAAHGEQATRSPLVKKSWIPPVPALARKAISIRLRKLSRTRLSMSKRLLPVMLLYPKKRWHGRSAASKHHADSTNRCLQQSCRLYQIEISNIMIPTERSVIILSY